MEGSGQLKISTTLGDELVLVPLCFFFLSWLYQRKGIMNDKLELENINKLYVFIPIVFKKDCLWEESLIRNRIISPLNIHKIGCLDVVRRNGWNIWNVSRRNHNDITNNQQSLFN